MNDIINNYNKIEKEILETFISKSGFNIKVFIAEKKTNSSEIDGVEWIGSNFGSITVSDIEVDRKIVFLNKDFSFQEINLSLLENDNGNNFNNIEALINGNTIPKGSKIEFENFNITLFIQSVHKNRPLSYVNHYILSR